MKKLFLLIALMLFGLTSVYSMERYNGYCEQGGQKVTTYSLDSTTKVQRSYPSCTVTVNIHSSIAATLFSDSVGTPLANPFVANTDGSYSFYAANGKYDITMSVGGMTSPYTLWEVQLSDTGSLDGSIAIDVMSIGAKCDGTSDDSPAIQSGLNAILVAGGGTLNLPYGTKRRS
jgi:hypothetical protein